MSKILAGFAAFALLGLALPAPASAAEQRANGLRTGDATMTTDVSTRRRHFNRGYAVRRHVWGPRYGYWGPRSYAYDPYYRPYWGPRAYVGGPGFGFGFGPRYW